MIEYQRNSKYGRVAGSQDDYVETTIWYDQKGFDAVITSPGRHQMLSMSFAEFDALNDLLERRE